MLNKQDYKLICLVSMVKQENQNMNRQPCKGQKNVLYTVEQKTLSPCGLSYGLVDGSVPLAPGRYRFKFHQALVFAYCHCFKCSFTERINPPLLSHFTVLSSNENIWSEEDGYTKRLTKIFKIVRAFSLVDRCF